MRRLLVLLTVALLLSPIAALAQDGKLILENTARSLGAPTLKTLTFTGTGDYFFVGQSVAPGAPWPRFVLKSFTRSINYDTASIRTEQTLVRPENTPGGGVPGMGEARQNFWLSGDRAWRMMADAASPQPRDVADNTLQLWATPHGVIKAAMANNATVDGRNISFTIPGRMSVKATINNQYLIEKVEAVIPNQVLGDIPVEVSYSDYKETRGVRFPMKIRQSAGGHPSLDLTVSEVTPNESVDITVPPPVREATNPYGRVTSQMVAEGVWYLTGGSHHSVAIEMKDHLILVEGPLDDSRALAVLAEARKLAPNKPVRYVITSHHHFDHTGGIRAMAGEGVTVITHESSRAFFEKALATPARVSPDHLTKSGKRATVEGVGAKRVLTDGTRTVEIHHVAGSRHGDGMLMVYLPKEKLMSQADLYTPAPPNAPPPAAINQNSVNLAENVTRLNLAIDQLLPLHGRIVPLSELHKAIGRAN
jgi:glyoxylase-like metal-dependent hydrolase (beta-lactamase superfamily II)